MTENHYSFEIPKQYKSIIKVIGVGGGGSNAVNHMFNQGIKKVEFIVCNTDHQSLMSSPVQNKLQLGSNLTQGLGAGANPEKGREAALESREEIREMLSDDTNMVFITAGMGGGTGTGAAPIIAEVARELGILTVGIVTAPFGFEGRKKMELAKAGITELKNSCDTVLVILNDKLREVFGNLSIRNAFAQADNVLTTAAKGIAEIITVPGYVNVDFEDVKTVMSNSGTAVMGASQSDGEGRALRAAEEALNSPLLNEKDIHGAQKILLSIISGEEAELQMDELIEITDYIKDMAGDEAEVIFGHGIDSELGENIRVTVIATGFDKKDVLDQEQNQHKVIDLESNKPLKKSSPQISMFDINENKPEENEAPIEPPRTYIFEKPQPEEKANSGLSDHKVGLDEQEEVLEEIVKPDQMESVQDGKYELEMKKELLARQSQERVERLKKMKRNPINDEDFKEKYNQPAYQRRNVTLKDTPNSWDESISRYSLNDDNHITGNNKFLHDNVD